MTRTNCLFRVGVAVSLLTVSCARSTPPNDTQLTLRQASLGRAIEAAIGVRDVTIVVTQGTTVIRRQVIPISSGESDEVRRLFWRALRHEPSPESKRPIMDLVFGHKWKGLERTWTVTVEGPLTPYEYEAFEYFNTILPEEYREYRFRVDLMKRAQSR